MKRVWVGVRDYFFEPVSAYPLGVFRILFGLCVGATLLLLHAEWLAWFGVHGWVSMETIGQAETGFRLNLLDVMPQDDGWIAGLYWVLLGAAVTLTVGLGTRVSSVIVYLGLNTLNQRNPLILHGGDTFLRAAGFLLIFAPAGAALSVDRVLRRRADDELIVPWAQRLIQFQLAVVYLSAFLWKMKGAAWRSGTALFTLVHLRDMARFPVPGFVEHGWVLHLGTWVAMAFELAFPLLIWFRPFRRPLLVAGVLFHLALDYAFNIPMFEWDMLCAYPLFLEGEWWRKASASSTAGPLGGGAEQEVGSGEGEE